MHGIQTEKKTHFSPNSLQWNIFTSTLIANRKTIKEPIGEISYFEWFKIVVFCTF